MDYIKLFNTIHKDFFNREYIKKLRVEEINTELVLDLHNDFKDTQYSPYPSNIKFSEFKGNINLIKEAVRKVEKDWVQYFNKDELMFCGFDGDKIVSFCKITDQGIIDGLHVGDPGCVGTIPEYRKQGIGLELVRLATKLLKDDGFDISWIHGTPVPNWYTKLGYKPVLRWNKNGFIKWTTPNQKLLMELASHLL